MIRNSYLCADEYMAERSDLILVYDTRNIGLHMAVDVEREMWYDNITRAGGKDGGNMNAWIIEISRSHESGNTYDLILVYSVGWRSWYNIRTERSTA